MSIAREKIQKHLEEKGFPYELAFNTSWHMFNNAQSIHEALGKLTDEQILILEDQYPEIINLADLHGTSVGGRRYNKTWLQSRARAQFEEAVFNMPEPDIN